MELQASQPHLSSWEGYDTNPLGNFSSYMKDKKVIENS